MKPSKQVVVGSRCFCPEPAMRGVGMELGVSSAFNLIRDDRRQLEIPTNDN